MTQIGGTSIMNDKYLRKAKTTLQRSGRYERYNLKENPFPSSPFVNPESDDKRIAGLIYEPSIRQQEFEIVQNTFLGVPQDDPNHLRLGYILDTSYIGRGNGKSAFLLHLQREINRDFALRLSNGHNKCFAVIVTPEPSGRTKRFDDFSELLFKAILRSKIIDISLATLRLQTIADLYPNFDLDSLHFDDDEDFSTKLNSESWFKSNDLEFREVTRHLRQNEYVQKLPRDFPLNSSSAVRELGQDAFESYFEKLKKGEPRLEFLFSHLVNLFLAAGFNGAYVFVDDFERIPEYQSARQKRDFALGIRSCLFDGMYVNARIGFYNLLFVFHAGVPRIIQEAWDQSGLDHRAPIFTDSISRHIIPFEKMGKDDVVSLILKYLSAYRIERDEDSLNPFTENAVYRMASIVDFNASRLLQMSHETLELAVDKDITEIDEAFVSDSDGLSIEETKKPRGIQDEDTKNLMDD